MVSSLNPEKFHSFGRIESGEICPLSRINRHCIPLDPAVSSLYETAGETWIGCGSGRAILSVSLDGKTFQDYYLSRSAVLHPCVYFALTAFDGPAAAELGGCSFPRLLRTFPAEESYVTLPKLRITRLYSVFYQEAEPGFRQPGQSHSCFQLTYVDRGSLHCVAQGQELHLETGDLLLTGPGQWFMQYARPEEAPRLVYIRFEAEGLPWDQILCRRFRSHSRRTELLRQLLREQEQMEAGAEDMILSLLSMLLLSLIREKEGDNGPLQVLHSLNGEQAIIGRAQTYIAAHVRQRLTVPETAAGVGLSPSYLTALFQKHLQISPGEYIRRVRLQESRQMIREGKMNFTEIAKALEYSGVSQFSRQFKETFGITPSQYARSVRG